eukprot:369972_1
MKIGREASMAAKNPVVYNGSHRHAVEGIAEHLPQFRVVTTFALVEKAIDSIDACRLMVPSQKEEVEWVLDLVCEEEGDGLDRLGPPVHVVAEEEIVVLRRKAGEVEYSKEIQELPVNVATDLHRSPDLQEDRLGHKDIPRFQDEIDNLLFGEAHHSRDALI